jgi:hypothetical protein
MTLASHLWRGGWHHRTCQWLTKQGKRSNLTSRCKCVGRNTTSWTVLKLEVTALISFKMSRNVNPTTPQQEIRNLIFSNTAVRTWNLAVNIPDSVDTAATLFRPPKYRADVTGVVKIIVFKYVWILRYKSESRGFDSRWCHWNFSLT